MQFTVIFIICQLFYWSGWSMMDHKKCTKCPLKLTRAQLHIFVQTDFFTGKYPMKTVYSRRCGNEKKMGVNCVFLILWFIVDNNWMQHSQKFRVLFCLSWKIWHRQWSTRRHGELKENWCCWLRMGHSRLFCLFFSLTFFPRHKTISYMLPLTPLLPLPRRWFFFCCWPFVWWLDCQQD